MEAKLRYELAGDLGRIYRNKTEIVDIAKATTGLDSEDIPDGTPRTIWLAVLVELANNNRREAIADLLAEARTRSELIDWKKYEGLATIPSSTRPAVAGEPATPAPQWSHPSLDVRWHDELEGVRESTRIGDTRQLLEITATLQYSGTPPVARDQDLSNNGGTLSQNGKSIKARLVSSEVEGLLVWRTTIPLTPNKWRTLTNKIVWACDGEERKEVRRLVPTKGAVVAAISWLVFVGLFPIFWLYPVHTTIGSIFAGASGAATLTALFSRFVDVSGIRRWIHSSMAVWERAVPIGFGIALLVALAPIAVFHQATNLTGSELKLDDETLAVEAKTTRITRIVREHHETCDCDGEACKCPPRGPATRWVQQVGIRCKDNDCAGAKHQLPNGATATYTLSDTFSVTDMTFEAGVATRAMTIYQGSEPSSTKPKIEIAISGVLDIPRSLPVPVGEFTIVFEGVGALVCLSTPKRIVGLDVQERTLPKGRNPPADTRPRTLSGALGGVGFQWAGKRVGNYRACAGSGDKSTFDELAVACDKSFDHLTPIEVEPATESIRLSFDSLESSFALKAGSSKVVWACRTNASGQLEVSTDQTAGFRFLVPRGISKVSYKGVTVPCTENKTAWIVRAPADPPAAISNGGRVGFIRDLGLALVCGEKGAKAPHRGNTCTLTETSLECVPPTFVHVGTCTRTLNGEIVKNTDTSCTRESSIDDELRELIKARGLKRNFKCLTSEQCKN